MMTRVHARGRPALAAMRPTPMRRKSRLRAVGIPVAATYATAPIRYAANQTWSRADPTSRAATDATATSPVARSPPIATNIPSRTGRPGSGRGRWARGPYYRPRHDHGGAGAARAPGGRSRQGPAAVVAPPDDVALPAVPRLGRG